MRYRVPRIQIYRTQPSENEINYKEYNIDLHIPFCISFIVSFRHDECKLDDRLKGLKRLKSYSNRNNKVLLPKIDIKIYIFQNDDSEISSRVVSIYGSNSDLEEPEDTS